MDLSPSRAPLFNYIFPKMLLTLALWFLSVLIQVNLSPDSGFLFPFSNYIELLRMCTVERQFDIFIFYVPIARLIIDI